MTIVLDVKLPIKTVSEANVSSEHWTKKHKRHARQKEAIFFALTKSVQPEMLPCVITLTRIASRRLDSHDNLPMSFKFILDALASLLIVGKASGQADSDNRIQVKYDQIRGLPHEYAIKVKIEKLEKEKGNNDTTI